MDQELQAKTSLAQLLFENHWLSHARLQCQEALANGNDKGLELLLKIEDRLHDPLALDLSQDHAPIAVLMDKKCIISTLHFKNLESDWLKKEAFRQAVHYIDIETSSQCNRKCTYCPNSTNDRFSSNQFIEDSVFFSFINDLHAIEYDKELHFVGYNEPLLYMSNILGRIDLARRLLPKAIIVVFTNGDFLEREGVDQLIASGVNKIIISVHLPVKQAYNDESIFIRINKIAKKLSTPIIPLSYVKDTMISARLVDEHIDIIIQQTDYDKLGSNRASTLDGVGQQVDGRTAACLMPIYQFIVGYQGAVVPCCVMVSDDPRNAQYVVGKIGAGTSIFDTYCNKNFVAWRRSLFNLNPKKAPCQKCNWDVAMPALNAPTLYDPWQHLVAPPMTAPMMIA